MTSVPISNPLDRIYYAAGGYVLHAPNPLHDNGAVANNNAAANNNNRAAANTILGWISTRFSSCNEATCNEMEFTKKVTDLRYGTLELKEPQGISSLCQKIDDLAAVLRLKKQNKFASELETQKAALEREQKNSSRFSAPHASELLLEGIREIHDLCLRIIQNELPKEVKTCLLEMKYEIEKGGNFQYDKITKIIEKLKKIYSGSLFDLPFPGNQMTKLTHQGSFFNKSKLLDTGNPKKPTRSLVQLFMNEEFKSLELGLLVFTPFELEVNRQGELLKCLLKNENPLSDFHKKHLIPAILAIKSLSLDDKLSLIEMTYEKGADLSGWEVLWEEPEFIVHLLSPKVALLQIACLHGWGMCFYDKPSKSNCNFLKRMHEYFGSSWRNTIHSNKELYQLLEIAIDFGGNLLDVMEQSTVDKIQHSISQHSQGNNQDSVSGMAATPFQTVESIKKSHDTKEGYTLPPDVYEWEFALFQRWKLEIQIQVKQRVRSLHLQQIDEGLSGKIDPAVIRIAEAAAGGIAEVIRQYQWPKELLQLIMSYHDVSKEIALEVQRRRMSSAQSQQIRAVGATASKTSTDNGVAAGIA